MNFLSTITKSLRRRLCIHPPAELFRLSKEKARSLRCGYQEVSASALRSEGISSAKRSHRIAGFLSAVIEHFGKSIAPSPQPQRPVILPSGNCHRAAPVTTALLHA
jgi:hypothetical protein